MPTIDLRPEEKKYLLVTKPDIIRTIRKNITDGEILEDIVSNIEDQIVARVGDMGRVAIPFLGSFVPNEGKLDVLEHRQYMKEKRQQMDRQKYEEFRREFIRKQCKTRRGFRTKAVIVARTARFNRKRAIEILKKYGDDSISYRLYFLFLGKAAPIYQVEKWLEDIDKWNNGYD